MKSEQNNTLRLWPGIVLVILQYLLWLVVPQFSSGGTATSISVFGALVCSILIVVWWLFFSRAQRGEKWFSAIVTVVSLVIGFFVVHESISTGLAGMMYILHAIPSICLVFVIYAIISRKLTAKGQRIIMVILILIGSTVWSLFRSEGITGNAQAQLTWRWTPTNENLLSNEMKNKNLSISSLAHAEVKWAGYRGNNRDGLVHGSQISTDWETNPPKELWRKPVGSSCSSFSVLGNLIFTQEQRGENEVVSCYHLQTGEPIWQHSDEARFYDSHAGAGPRSTPTIHDSLLVTLGATGILNVLYIHSGEALWTRNAVDDHNIEIPGWGICSSPLIVGDVIIIGLSGTIAAYDLLTGKPLWNGESGGENYSSAHLVNIEGVEQVVFLSQISASSYVPADGTVLWKYEWGGGAIVQPALLDNGDLLLSEGYKKGIHRFRPTLKNGNWELEQIWTTKKIRPDFNDFVIHKEYLYGYEGHSLVCIDLADGTRKWKSGRYGGQMICLADQDLLILVSEKGKLVAVEANPEEYKELASLQAIEGKTWNHPILVDNILLARNTKEMVALGLGK